MILHESQKEEPEPHYTYSGDVIKYFISYEWRSSGTLTWEPSHALISEHPLTWLYDTDKDKENFHLLWWKRLAPGDLKYIRDHEDLPLV